MPAIVMHSPLAAEITDEVSDVPINLNGVLRVRCARGTPRDEVHGQAIRLLNRLLAEAIRTRPSEGGVTIRDFDGECWSREGHVLVGDLAFDVDHDPGRGMSCATVDIVPAQQSFGANHLYAKLTTHTERDQVAITAFDPANQVEQPLVAVCVEHGDVVLHIFNRGADKKVSTTPSATVRLPGLTMMRH